MQTISTTVSNYIVYDMNHAFGFPYIQPNIASNSLNIELSMDSTQQNIK